MDITLPLYDHGYQVLVIGGNYEFFISLDIIQVGLFFLLKVTAFIGLFCLLKNSEFSQTLKYGYQLLNDASVVSFNMLTLKRGMVCTLLLGQILQTSHEVTCPI